jgi:hypothetical protein
MCDVCEHVNLLSTDHPFLHFFWFGLLLLFCHGGMYWHPVLVVGGCINFISTQNTILLWPVEEWWWVYMMHEFDKLITIVIYCHNTDPPVSTVCTGNVATEGYVTVWESVPNTTLRHLYQRIYLEQQLEKLSLCSSLMVCSMVLPRVWNCRHGVSLKDKKEWGDTSQNRYERHPKHGRQTEVEMGRSRRTTGPHEMDT